MMMSEAMNAVLSVLAGAALGTVFFVGLWWTVGRVLTGPQPGLLMLASMLGRTAMAVGGFYLVAGDSWQQLMFCLAGFIMARLLVTRLLPSHAPDMGVVRSDAA